MEIWFDILLSMARNPEYQEFLDLNSGRKVDTLPQDEEFPATDQEIGWREQQQVRRAIGHARASRATIEELRYLAKHGLFYPTTPKSFRNLYIPK